MQFKVATLLSIIALAYAAPQVGTEIPAVPGDITVGQAGDSCGENLSLSCCNKVDQSGDSVNEASGILSGFLGDAFSGEGLGLFDGCSKLDITAGIVGGGVSDLLNSQCKQTVACCQHSGSTNNGLVAVGLPCVALGGLL